MPCLRNSLTLPPCLENLATSTGARLRPLAGHGCGPAVDSASQQHSTDAGAGERALSLSKRWLRGHLAAASTFWCSRRPAPRSQKPRPQIQSMFLQTTNLTQLLLHGSIQYSSLESRDPSTRPNNTPQKHLTQQPRRARFSGLRTHPSTTGPVLHNAISRRGWRG